MGFGWAQRERAMWSRRSLDPQRRDRVKRLFNVNLLSELFCAGHSVLIHRHSLSLRIGNRKKEYCILYTHTVCVMCVSHSFSLSHWPVCFDDPLKVLYP